MTYQILLIQPHFGHVEQEDRAKRLRDLKIVRRTHRLAAQVVEAEFGCMFRAFGDADRTAPRLKSTVVHGRVGRVGRVRGPDLIDLLSVLFGERVIVNVG